MANRSISYRLQAEISGFQAQLAAASASVRELGDEMTANNEQGRAWRDELDEVGQAAGVVGGIAAAGLGGAILASANFDQAMSNVQAATHESAASMEDLRQAALDAGQDTVFSATESAAAIENLAKAGVSTEDILGGGLTGALDLAAAGGLDVASSAEIAATALVQFNLAGSDMGHVADLLAAGAGKAQGEVADLGMALNQSGLVASQMGLSIEETTGTLAAFASAGLIGSDAGTSFKTMLQRLANPSQEASRAMDQFGISAYDAEGNLRPLSEIADQLQTAFAGQSQATRDAAMATIFGSDAIRAANVLYNEGAAGITDWTSKVDDAGYASETAAARMDNLKGDVEKLKGAFETAFIKTGDPAQGGLRGLTQGATELVDAYADLPDSAHGAVTATLAVTAAVGLGTLGFTKLVGAAASARANLAMTQRVMASGAGTLRTYAANLAAVPRSLSTIATRSMSILAPTERELARSTAAVNQLKSAFLPLGRAALPLAGIGLMATGTADAMEMTNTVMFGMIGGALGPWGAAVGVAGGFALDTRKKITSLTESTKELDAVMADAESSAQARLDGLSGALEDFNAQVSDNENITGVGDFFGDIYGPNNPDTLLGDLTGAQGRLDDMRDSISESKNEWRSLISVLQQANTSLGGEGFDWVSAWRDSGDTQALVDNFGEIDSMVQSITPALNEMGLTLDDVMSIDGYGDQLAMGKDIADMVQYLDSAQGKADQLADAFSGTDNAIMSSAEAAKVLEQRLSDAVDPQIAASAAADGWITSLRGLSGEVNKNNKSLEGLSNAAIQNRAAMRDRVAMIKGNIAAEAAAGASGRDLGRMLQGQRRQLINTATAAGLSRKEAARYANQLGLTPRLVRTVFRELGISKVQREARELRNQIRQLPPRVRIAIREQGIPQTRKQVNDLEKDVGGLTKKERKLLLKVQKDAAERGIKSVDDLADKLDKKKPNPKIEVDKTSAINGINDVERELNSLDGKTSHTYIYTHHVNVGDKKKSYSRGGYTGDGDPAMTAGVVEYREFVMPQDKTAMYRSELEAMHAGTFRRQQESRGLVHAAPYAASAAAAGPLEMFGAAWVRLDGPGWSKDLDVRMDQVATKAARREVTADRRFAHVHNRKG